MRVGGGAQGVGQGVRCRCGVTGKKGAKLTDTQKKIADGFPYYLESMLL